MATFFVVTPRAALIAVVVIRAPIILMLFVGPIFAPSGLWRIFSFSFAVVFTAWSFYIVRAYYRVYRQAR